jgi:hypothetical protein
VVDEHTGGITLILVSESADRPSAQELEVSDSGGRLLWRQEGLVRNPSGDYTVSLPPEVAAAELLRAELLTRVGGRRVVVERYEIRVRR